MASIPKLELKKIYSFLQILFWAAEQKRKGRILPADLEELLERNRFLLESADSRPKIRLPYNSLAFYYNKIKQGKFSFIPHIKHINPIFLYYAFNLELERGGQNIEVKLSLEQFKQLEYSIERLFYFHGNIALTGAPLIPGAISPVIFFQWGNLLGVIKYVVLTAEKSLVGNLLLRIEDMQDLKIEAVLLNYLKRNFNLMLTPEELMQQCTPASPQKLPELLLQYTTTVNKALLQSPSLIAWPPRLIPRPGPYGSIKDDDR